MTKVKGPLFSVRASGTLGGAITYKRGINGQRVERVPRPRFTESTKQLEQREKFKVAIAEWREYTAQAKECCEEKGNQLGITGYNYALMLSLLGRPNPCTIVVPPTLGRALYFDGVYCYAKGSLTGFPSAGDPFSMEKWVKIPEEEAFSESWYSIMNVCGSNDRFIEFRIVEGTKIQANIYTGSDNYIEADSDFERDKDYYLALVYDGSKMYFFIDHVIQNGGVGVSVVPNYDETLTLRVAIKYNETHPLEMVSDEIRLSSVARSQEEITENYQDGLGKRMESDENTVGLWHLDDLFWESYTVAYEAGVFYATHLTLETLANGDIICYYYKNDQHWGGWGASSICYKTSSNGGITWSAETTIVAAVPGHFIAMGGGGKTPEGKYILFYTDRESGDCGVVKVILSDNGTTFGTPSTVLDYEDDILLATARMISVESKLFQPINRYAQPGSVESIAGIWSPDGGITWGTWDYDGEGGGTQNQYTLIKEDAAKRLCELSFVYLGSGKIIGLIRSNASGEFYQLKSETVGETWGNLEATGWYALDEDYTPTGSMVQIELYDNLIFATVDNRQTKEFEVKVCEANEAWSDATVWGTAPKHDYRENYDGWLGYCSVKLVSGNTAPMYHIVSVERDESHSYQELKCAIPQTPWDGKAGNDWTVRDETMYEQDLDLLHPGSPVRNGVHFAIEGKIPAA